ncbi:phosphatidylinositol alpha 1,6-mannosyltransferase [Branchiibius hedensis]|uniref:D-inositol 3-phosphate glycosyltransferase n=1 Tax=Branchiibius hedensis TaxID=672460 RepID=A0A2Y8ZRE1_9MICO|nr:glycosyltransferase family 1 protein [Branchiibius hedensis]PWJ26119.1 phosphatidylinositol alpha 1,6-mannosyltransferase [Branchiibius hedensis]SSA34931.1 phosphatidylinositol alpha 1,6-mannosyltransferase [Branchiibius hedensis]
MKVAIVTESFLPTLNGVTTSVCRILDEFSRLGHQAVVIAPRPAPAAYRGHRIHQVRGVTLRSFRVGVPPTSLEPVLKSFAPDVLHAASPFGLGARGLGAARNLGIPTVAIYQTDMPGYLAQYGGRPVASLSWRWVRHLHSLADLTLAPSTATIEELRSRGVPRVAAWGRGVDSDLFHPALRSHPDVVALRECLAPQGQTIVGYVGRLAPEKEVHRLEVLAADPSVSLVIVGDGPSRARLERLLPQAHFLGYRTGADLAQAYAALDVFVHTGTKETFGQTLQEAMASGLPVVAPAVGGPLDVLQAGHTGCFYDPGSPDDLQRVVMDLAGDPSYRDALGSAARQVAERRSWSRTVDQLLAYYEHVQAPRFAVAA